MRIYNDPLTEDVLKNYTVRVLPISREFRCLRGCQTAHNSLNLVTRRLALALVHLLAMFEAVWWRRN